MRQYRNDDRFKSNLQHIARTDEAMAKALSRLRPSSRLVMDDHGGVNIDLGGTLLYPDAGKPASERQMSEYMKQPLRVVHHLGKSYELCFELNDFIGAMRDAMAPFPMSTRPAPFAGYAVVFGVGLGYHLRMLADNLAFKTLIVVEPNDEFFVHSLHVQDWKGLIQSMARQGRTIRFVRAGDMFRQLIVALRGRHYPYLDGSYLFTHYQMPEFDHLTSRLFKEIDLAFMEGWLEDQLTMLRNASINLARPGLHLQTRFAASVRALPAMVVGAGPSLDNDIEEIRRCRPDVVLISASSALKVLLEHGIRPDIHCEVENSAGLGLVAEDLAARYGGLSDIALYASATVDPRVPPCFGQTAFFFRTGLCSTAFFGDGAISTVHSDPTSGNCAVYCALSLGFREIYLFGLDFGARNPDQHHSRHSVYYTYESEEEIATYTPYEFNVQVPGNFGGQVGSGWVLAWGSRSVSEAIRTFRNVRVMNCSDGVLIAQTTPQAAQAIALAPATMAGAADRERALAELSFQPSGVVTGDMMVGIRDRLRAALDGFVGHVAKAERGERSPQEAIIGVCDGIIAELEGLSVCDRGVYDTLISHTEALLAEAFHYASVISPAAFEGRDAILDLLIDGLERARARIDRAFDGRPFFNRGHGVNS